MSAADLAAVTPTSGEQDSSADHSQKPEGASPQPKAPPPKVYHGYENLFAEFGLLEDQERLFQELPRPPGASDAPTFYHLVQEQPGAAWLINDAPDIAVGFGCHEIVWDFFIVVSWFEFMLLERPDACIPSPAHCIQPLSERTTLSAHFFWPHHITKQT